MILKMAAAAACLLMLAGPAAAGDFHVVPHGSYLIDLDTQDGNFSQWETHDVGDINALRAHMTFARKGSGQYAPVVTVAVLSGDKEVRVQFTAFPKSGPLIGLVHGTKPDNGDKPAGIDDPNLQLVLMPPEFSEGFDLHVSWTPDGKVSFDVYDKANKSVGQGFEHHVMALDGPVTGIRLSNSTGEVEFNKLELGTEN